jgi:hypothetical protein
MTRSPSHFGHPFVSTLLFSWVVLTVCAAYLELSINNLTGTIPSEIDLLTSLCEFVGHRVPLSFFLALSALMNHIQLVCFSVSQMFCGSLAIILRRATTRVQATSSIVGSTLIPGCLALKRKLVALFEWCFNEQ